MPLGLRLRLASLCQTLLLDEPSGRKGQARRRPGATLAIALHKPQNYPPRLAYLHFDAKHRVERLTGIVGEDEEESGEERQISKATGNYKTADLYKMHTYNEAIRRTVGAYVLYPGDDPMNRPNQNRFQRYHEIVPGVGAFALRPDPNGEGTAAGLDNLLEFLRNLLSHQLSRF